MNIDKCGSALVVVRMRAVCHLMVISVTPFWWVENVFFLHKIGSLCLVERKVQSLLCVHFQVHATRTEAYLNGKCLTSQRSNWWGVRGGGGFVGSHKTGSFLANNGQISMKFGRVVHEKGAPTPTKAHLDQSSSFKDIGHFVSPCEIPTPETPKKFISSFM